MKEEKTLIRSLELASSTHAAGSENMKYVDLGWPQTSDIGIKLSDVYGLLSRSRGRQAPKKGQCREGWIFE